MEANLDEMCIGGTGCLRPVLEYVFSLSFEERPNYDLVGDMLGKAVIKTFFDANSTAPVSPIQSESAPSLQLNKSVIKQSKANKKHYNIKRLRSLIKPALTFSLKSRKIKKI